jgi:hypothetical protein
VTAAAVVERVRKRLASAGRDLEMAISFYEAARIPHLRADIQARFSDTEAGHTFVALRSATLFQAALTVMRLWDHHDDTASLVAIARDLQASELLDALSADAMERLGDDWGASIAEEKRRELICLRNLITRTKESRLRSRLERLRAYRDKRLAHRDPFENHRTELARTADVTDMVVVLAVSCTILRRARLAINFAFNNPRRFRVIRRRYSEAFWAIPLRVERHDED